MNFVITMAVPFYLPEGGADDTVSSGGTNSSDSASSAASSLQSSPNTTSSATQTPMQGPLLPSDLLMAFYETFFRYSVNSGAPVFQYPTPPSPSCSVHSPSYTGGEVFFPRSRSTPRIPRTSVSFAAGDEVNFFHQSAPASSSSGNAQTQTTQAPQSAPPVPNSHHHNQHQLHGHYPHFAYQHSGPGGGCYQYTPPPTPNTATATTSTGTSTSGSGCMPHRSLHRSFSDSARRSRLTSTGEDEREYQSEHETSWDEFDDRFDNFTAGRERLQEFSGRIPPRKKKKDVPKTKSEKKEHSFTWPAVVTVFVFAMGCGFLVAR